MGVLARGLWVAAVVTTLGGCAEPEPGPGPSPPGSGGGPNDGGLGPGETTTGDSATGASGTSATGACDPYGDPLVECGAGQECSLGDRTCQPSAGTGAVDEPCIVTDSTLLLDSCTPQLVCAFDDVGAGRCVLPCDAINPTCSGSCVAVGPSSTPICLAGCTLLTRDCARTEDGCYPLEDVRGQTVAACVPSGDGGLGDRCDHPGECQSGMTCTPSMDHTGGCMVGAACCTPLCDINAPECFDVEPTCVPLDLIGQATAGFCGTG